MAGLRRAVPALLNHAWRFFRTRVNELPFSQIATLSVDPVDSHNAWLRDVVAHCENKITVDFPIIGVADRYISVKYNMYDPSNLDDQGLPLTIRAVFIIDPETKLKLVLNYPASVGRNTDEICRCIEALQLSAKNSVATPVRLTRRPSNLRRMSARSPPPSHSAFSRLRRTVRDGQGSAQNAPRLARLAACTERDAPRAPATPPAPREVLNLRRPAGQLAQQPRVHRDEGLRLPAAYHHPRGRQGRAP